MSQQDTPFYISNVHLSGYKTLKDVAIDFQPGLNIIIGKNGVGKTNFLSLFSSVVNVNIESYKNLHAAFNWKNKGYSEHWEINRKLPSKVTDSQIKTEPDTHITISSPTKSKSYSSVSELLKDERDYHGYFIADYIKHNIHNSDLPFLSLPFRTSDTSSLFHDYYNDFDLPYFIRAIMVQLTFNVKPFSDITNIKKDVLAIISAYRNTLSLEDITAIEDFRFKDDFKIVQQKTGGPVSIQNLAFEFKVYDKWISYLDLSDGTRRLFNIVLDLAYSQAYFTTKGVWGYGDGSYRVILLEEPELGIHPHQLHKLMLFIKEQSKFNQIIITTHSPDVLDVLGKDDLDRIIIADYEPAKGTQLRHLTDDEKKKASTYMENEAFLSDYWKYSNLEK